MFKKKPIYILLLIVFTALLAAAIASYVYTANSASDATTDTYGRGQMGTMPDMSGTEFDTSQMPDMTGEAFDPENMPDMTGEGFDSSQMPDMAGEGFDRTQMQNFPGATATQDTGVVGTVAAFLAKWWILIGALCLLVDALCIVMIVRIGRNAPVAEDFPAEMEYRAAIQEEHISSYEKRRRKRRKMAWVLGIIAAVILLAAGGLFAARRIYDAQLAEAEAVEIVSAQAAEAEIESAIYGAGTLEETEAETISVPDGVKIAEYFVENGDKVEAGDVIAAVDHTSVMTTIALVQEAMDELDDDINDASDDTIEGVIESPVDGRVKVVYAEAGTAVADTMYEYGALMLISLDGMMAADIETDADIAAGDTVTVFLSDGTEEEGTAEKISNGVVTVTVTDDKTIYNDAVTVYDEDGNMLGTANLYIHSELKITGYAGTVTSIRRVENATIKSGYQLLRLTDTDYTAEHELLLEQRAEYEDVMMQLFKLYQDNHIYAAYSGTVSDIDETNIVETNLPESTEETGIIETAVPSGQLTESIMTLSCNTQTQAEDANYLLVYSDFGVERVLLLGNNPKGTDDTTVSAYSNFAAKVSKVTYGAIMLSGYTTADAITDYTAPGISESMMVNEKQISPEDNAPVYIYTNGAWAQMTLNDISAGDTIIVTYNGSADSDIVWIVVVNKSQAAGTSGSSMPSSGGSSSGGSAGTATVVEEKTAEEVYPIAQENIASITPSEKMSVTITIDEMDILLLKKGQEAVITLDAVDGEVFSGTVTDIDMSGTNSGGSTKYTAIVELDRTGQMLSGMNAYVSIGISSAQCSITVPVAAIIEYGTDTYVYTSYNEEEEALGSLTAVTTGLSDGTNVEILSGLNAGSTVWYEYNDTVNISSSIVDSSSGGGFNFMRILGGR